MFWTFEHLNFGFVSNFDIGLCAISDLLFLSLYANKRTNRVPVKVGRIKFQVSYSLYNNGTAQDFTPLTLTAYAYPTLIFLYIFLLFDKG